MILLPALVLGGCETTQEKSARLERLARHTVLTERGLSIAHANPYVRVVAAQVLHSPEGNAAVVTLRNVSGHALRDVPLAISVKDAGGRVLFQNDSPGLEAALTSVALLKPGERFSWVDDQVQASGIPASVSAVAGVAPRAPGSLPRVSVSGVHSTKEASGAGAAGTVLNGSAVAQRELVVYVIARRHEQIVAAGRAVLPEVAAHHSSSFQVYLIGNPSNAQLQAAAPPTTF